MHEHVFADESKAKGFILAAVPVAPAGLTELRATMGTLRLRNRLRLHFNRESDSTRKMIIGRLIDANTHARIYDATMCRDGALARRTTIARLADDVVEMGADRLVLELDESVVRTDRQVIRSRLLKLDAEGGLRYEHLRASQECLLAIPDAIAWCWARGDKWRKLAQPLIIDTVTLY